MLRHQLELTHFCFVSGNVHVHSSPLEWRRRRLIFARLRLSRMFQASFDQIQEIGIVVAEKHVHHCDIKR